MPTIGDLADGLDSEAGMVLRVLEREGGSANTSEIREATNLSNGQVRRRREMLLERDLIETTQPETGNGRQPPTVHTLTERGEAVLDEGLLTRLGVADLDADPEVLAILKQLHADVHELHDRVDDLGAKTGRINKRIRDRLGDAGEGESIEVELQAIHETLEEHEERLENKKDKRRW